MLVEGVPRSSHGPPSLSGSRPHRALAAGHGHCADKVALDQRLQLPHVQLDLRYGTGERLGQQGAGWVPWAARSCAPKRFGRPQHALAPSQPAGRSTGRAGCFAHLLAAHLELVAEEAFVAQQPVERAAGAGAQAVIRWARRARVLCCAAALRQPCGRAERQHQPARPAPSLFPAWPLSNCALRPAPPPT